MPPCWSGGRHDGRIAPCPDPARLAVAYRAWAVAHAGLYALMTAEPLPRDRLPPGLEAAAADPLLSAFGDEHVARAVWASAHGLVTLEAGRPLPARGRPRGRVGGHGRRVRPVRPLAQRGPLRMAEVAIRTSSRLATFAWIE